LKLITEATPILIFQVARARQVSRMEQPEDTRTPSSPPSLNFRLRRLNYLGEGEMVQKINRTTEEFMATFPELKQRCDQLEALVNDCKHCEVYSIAQDFYQAYYSSSGLLTSQFGPARLLRCFELLYPYFRTVNPDETEALKSMPEEITVYRGGRPPTETLTLGISWTTHQQIAAAFMDTPGDLVIRTRIPRKHLFAYYFAQCECILDPARLVPGTVERVLTLE